MRRRDDDDVDKWRRARVVAVNRRLVISGRCHNMLTDFCREKEKEISRVSSFWKCKKLIQVNTAKICH